MGTICHPRFCNLGEDRARSNKRATALVRAPDTSPVEEGNPERKGMRNGEIRTEADCFGVTAEAPDLRTLSCGLLPASEARLMAHETQSIALCEAAPVEP